MQALGIIVEYNPFHYGHLYHLQQCKKLYPDKKIVCILSSNFVQRGEPAFIDKWLRTEIALKHGADLVIELPFAFSCRSAEYFAKGAVSLLNDLGICDTLVFGTENPDMEKLKFIARVLAEEPERFQDYLTSYLNEGLSFPGARQRALISFLKGNPESFDLRWESDHSVEEVLQGANNILAIEYIKALYMLSSDIQPRAIQRIGENYHSPIINRFASASAIRSQMQKTGNLEEIKEALPPASLEIISEACRKGKGPVFLEAFFPEIALLLRRYSTEDLRSLEDVTEGFENRLKEAGKKASGLNDLIDRIKTRRYTWTRIQRILIYLLVNFTKKKAASLPRPEYVRILGFTFNGRKLIRKIKQNSRLPVITRPARFIRNNNLPRVRACLELEAVATDIYSLGRPGNEERYGGQEWTTPPVILEH